MGSDSEIYAAGADVISLAQWKVDHPKEPPPPNDEADAFAPSGLPPFDRERQLQKWLSAFEQYAAAYEFCRLDREQATAAVEKAVDRGRTAEDQAGWFDMAAAQLVRAATFLDTACARVELAGSTVQALA